MIRCRSLLLVFVLCAPQGLRSQHPAEEPPDGEESGVIEEPSKGADFPLLHPEGEPYHTPVAGEAFRTTVFGRDIEVFPRDRRFVSAWDVGLAATAPGADENEILPFASLFFWRNPDEDTLFRAVVAGVFNEVLYHESPEGFGPFEWVATFENFTVPVDQGEIVDGRRVDEEELLWGYVRGGVGLGYRRPVAPWAQDNLLLLNLTFEPSFLYFDEGSDAAPNFEAPEESFESRVHLRFRMDRMVRNLLELPHLGVTGGADLSYGYRTGWESWGIDRSISADEGRDFLLFTGYAVAAAPVPFIDSDRHRLLGYLHGGIGSATDRFSAQRVGGGPQGEELFALARPVLPGAAINEFFPEHYVVGVAEYRWEPIFFTYLSARGSLAYLDRQRRSAGGIRQEDDGLASIGARVTTGFLGETRLQIDYNFSFGVIRQGEFGGHEVMAHISREF